MSRRDPETFVFAILGAILVGLTVALAFLGRRFVYGEGHLDRPIALFVLGLLVAGLVYLLAVSVARRLRADGWTLGLLLVVALGLRLPWFVAGPIQEDDPYRYLWDGARLAIGQNPYRPAPAELRRLLEGVGPTDPEHLGDAEELHRRYGRELDLVLARVNHPEIPTVYPPTAQWAFALAAALQPGSLVAWRIVLLAFDLGTIACLWLLLRRLGLPPLFVLVYAWCPLVAKEFVNSAHVDLVGIFFLALSVCLLVARRSLFAGAAFALAVGGKLFPVILLPAWLAWEWRTSGLRALARSAGGFAVAGAALLAPFLDPELSVLTGLGVYARDWQMNDGLFQLVELAWGLALPPAAADRLARLTVGALALGIVALVAFHVLRRTPRPDARHLFGCLLLVLAVAFLLSPTQFPWYFLWTMPFLVVHPRSALLLLVALLPIYYLRFHFDYRGEVELYDRWVVWCQYVPVFFALAIECTRKRIGHGRETVSVSL